MSELGETTYFFFPQRLQITCQSSQWSLVQWWRIKHTNCGVMSSMWLLRKTFVWSGTRATKLSSQIASKTPVYLQLICHLLGHSLRRKVTTDRFLDARLTCKSNPKNQSSSLLFLHQYSSPLCTVRFLQDSYNSQTPNINVNFTYPGFHLQMNRFWRIANLSGVLQRMNPASASYYVNLMGTHHPLLNGATRVNPSI